MITQGQFSFLPPLTDAQIAAQVEYALKQGWALSVEHTDDPHPRNTYWEMHGMPMFDLREPAGILAQIEGCRGAFPERYVRVIAFDSTRGWETPRMSFIVNRPRKEPRLALERQEAQGRILRYTVR
jgi:ribulose-bisphosphate carboxylase small chain